MSVTRIIAAEIRIEQDIVLARQRARHVAQLLGFSHQEQTRIATIISEVARNAIQYAGCGRVEFAVADNSQPILQITISDSGPGIPHLSTILSGLYTSKTGMGLGLLGAKRLMDICDITTSEAGTRVVLGKLLPPSLVVNPRQLSAIAAELMRQEPHNSLGEVRQQNQELLQTLDELRARQNQVELLNRELGDNNKAIRALYAELEEKAAGLKRVSEAKTRFLSSVTHELRTPVNGILAVCELLIKRMDGPLNSEQEVQAKMIWKSGHILLDLVNTLLDLAKIEAGRMDVTVTSFSLVDLLASLRGMFKPLLNADHVTLDIPDTVDILLETDQGKLLQILRNLLSNAAKFTDHGVIRLTTASIGNDTIAFHVSDTGIGISAENQARIFEEFEQIRGPLQARTKGTGLGLPLSRSLTKVLGGGLTLISAEGTGSTFTLTIPRRYVSQAPAPGLKEYSHGRT